MPDVSELSLSGAEVDAIAAKARLINAVLHCFKSTFFPTKTNVLADFLAAECNWDGYLPLTIPLWAVPMLSGDGYITYAPTQTFPWTFDTEGIGNQVGGTFLVLASGVLYGFTKFDPTRPCMGPSQGIITTPIYRCPAG